MLSQTLNFGDSEMWIYTLSTEWSLNVAAIWNFVCRLNTNGNFKFSHSLNQLPALPAHCPLIPSEKRLKGEIAKLREMVAVEAHWGKSWNA
jgi:hypothetical protein